MLQRGVSEIMNIVKHDYQILQEIDMIAADLTVTWTRMSVIDFSKPFLASSLTLLLKVSQ